MCLSRVSQTDMSYVTKIFSALRCCMGLDWRILILTCIYRDSIDIGIWNSGTTTSHLHITSKLIYRIIYLHCPLSILKTLGLRDILIIAIYFMFSNISFNPKNVQFNTPFRHIISCTYTRLYIYIWCYAAQAKEIFQKKST